MAGIQIAAGHQKIFDEFLDKIFGQNQLAK